MVHLDDNQDLGAGKLAQQQHSLQSLAQERFKSFFLRTCTSCATWEKTTSTYQLTSAAFSLVLTRLGGSHPTAALTQSTLSRSHRHVLLQEGSD